MPHVSAPGYMSSGRNPQDAKLIEKKDDKIHSLDENVRQLVCVTPHAKHKTISHLFFKIFLEEGVNNKA